MIDIVMTLGMICSFLAGACMTFYLLTKEHQRECQNIFDEWAKSTEAMKNAGLEAVIQTQIDVQKFHREIHLN